MARRLLVTLGVLMLGVSVGLAQLGKISGNVTDRQTGEPLIGANVLVVGTTLGAATDLDGRYVIFNVPPGLVDVRASFVGYQQVTIREVRITGGLTREVNFELPSTAIEVEPVVIVRERPLVEKSATNAIRILTSEEFENLPVRGTTDYFSLLPGVVVQDGRVYIRGGRPDEVGYVLEGANTRNIRSEGSLVSTIPEATEEVLVQAGGYNAEFGGANAGIVSQSFRTGREKYHALVQVESDNFADPGDKFLGAYSYGYTDVVVSLSGPLLTNKIKFFVAGENNFIRDYTPTFWTGPPETWSDGAPFGEVFDTGTRGGKKGDRQVLSWVGGNIPGRFSNRYTFNGTTLFDYKPILVRLAGTLSWARTRSNGIPLINMFVLDRLPLSDASNGMANLRVSYFPASLTFVELNLNYLDNRSKGYDAIFKDNLLWYADSVKAAEQGWQFRTYTDEPRPYDFHGFPFNRPGTPLTGLGKSRNGYIGGSLALTTQQARHELKLGGSIEYWTLRNYGMGGEAILNAMRASPDIARDPIALARLIRVTVKPGNYGYDEFGNEIDDDILLPGTQIASAEGPRHPVFAAAYIQDKVEFGDLIINAGLRYDYLSVKSWKVADPSRPDLDLTDYVVRNLEESEAQNFVQPRLGFSFPVTDRTVFHLQYGKFIQIPELDRIYRSRSQAAFYLTGQFFFTNPMGFDIQPMRTTQYEIGFTQQFTDFASFDITGFYKDIKNWLQYAIVKTAPGLGISPYPVYENGDFATTKGLEFRLTLRRVQRMQGFVNYTFSDARSTNSAPQSSNGALSVIGIRPNFVTPSTFDRTHVGSISLDYRFADNDGGPILERLGINLLFRFSSGHPYTKSTGGIAQQGADLGGILNNGDPRSREPIEALNSSRTPWTYTLDLRIDKSVRLAGVDFNVYAYVQNLFNTKNVTNVYYRTGNAYDDGFLTNPSLSKDIVAGLGQRYVDLFRAINLENRQSTWRTNGFDLFGSPRQIRFGFRVEL